MKLFLILAVVVAVSAAPPNNQDVQVLRYDVDNGGLGSYNFGWELSDGSSRRESGQLRNPGNENEGIAVQGQYSWIAPNGVKYTVTFTADEEGYKPTVEEGPGAPPGAALASLLG